MPAESLFLTMGGLGVSLAGFAGLIAALDRGAQPRTAVGAYRITSIVFLGFSLTVTGLLTVAAWTVTGGDVPATARIGTLLLLVPISAASCSPGPVRPGRMSASARSPSPASSSWSP